MKNIFIAVLVVMLLVVALAAFQISAPATPANQNNTPANNAVPANNSANANNSNFATTLAANGTKWKLWRLTLDNKTYDLKTTAAAPSTLQFDPSKNTYSGYSACNNFSGKYNATGESAFSFGPATSTEKGCPNTEDIETALYKAMTKTATFWIKGDQLVFTTPDGSTELVYDPVK